MKRTIVLAIALMLVLSFTGPVLADHDPAEKIKDGVMDILTVPYDLGKTTVDEVKGSDFKPWGLFTGLIKGAAHGVVDIVKGAVDIVTFPVDTSR